MMLESHALDTIFSNGGKIDGEIFKKAFKKYLYINESALVFYRYVCVWITNCISSLLMFRSECNHA